jgi:uncharacterized protein YjbJ (UPF0337 family)
MKANRKNPKSTKILKYFSKTIGVFLATFTICIGVFSNISSVNATPLNNNSHLLAIFSESTTDKVAGEAEKTLGAAQRNIAKVTGQFEGAVNEVKGKVREDIGTTKNAVEGSLKKAQNKAKKDINRTKNAAKKSGLKSQEDIISSQDAIQKSYDRVEKVSNDAIDSVKNIFDK